jgi:hypothetical protein
MELPLRDGPDCTHGHSPLTCGLASEKTGRAAAVVTCQPVFRGKLCYSIPANRTEGGGHVWYRSCS